MSLTDTHDLDRPASLADRRLAVMDRALADLRACRDGREADALHEWIMDGIVDTLVRDFPDVLEDLAMRWSETLEATP